MRYNVKCFSDHLCTAVENGQHQRGCTKEDEGAPLTIADKDRSFFWKIYTPYLHYLLFADILWLESP